jgi:hypothetical protein
LGRKSSKILNTRSNPTAKEELFQSPDSNRSDKPCRPVIGSYDFFKPTRSAKVITEKLRGYSGPVLTDGLESYDSVLDEAKIPHAYCWAHARRVLSEQPLHKIG